MPKRAVAQPLTLPARDPGVPAQRWLCAVLRAEILEGRLRPGGRLPGTRELADAHGLSRGTIVAAFEQLTAEGYLEGKVGSGTQVRRVLPDDLLQVARRPGAPRPVRPSRVRHFSRFGRNVEPFGGFDFQPTRAFQANMPALDHFPTTLWAQVAGRRIRRATTRDLLGSGATGFRPLQQAVADYLGASRGVRCIPEQVVIVTGVQEALDLVARLFLDPGDPVGLEDPGYVGARLTFEAMGAKILPLRVDAEGMETPGPQHVGARLVYLTPAHQLPLGVALSLPRRLALLEWARAQGALLFEDDYDSEYRYAGRPVPALQGLDRDGVVLFAGSFSKVLFPSLRLGYLVVPLDLLDPVAATISISSRHASVPLQAVLADFIAEGHFGRHLRRMREIYAERLGVLIDAVAERLEGLLELSTVEAGLQTAGWLPPGVDGAAVTRAAAARQVKLTPLSAFSRRKLPRDGLQLGFAAVDPPEIRRGVRELASILEAMRAPRRGSRREA